MEAMAHARACAELAGGAVDPVWTQGALPRTV